MTTKVKPIPEGYHTVTPYMIVKDAAKAIEFYKKALGAKEIMRMASPQGNVVHAEIKIGNSPVMLADECLEMGAKSPQSIGGSPIAIHLYVEDVDAVYKQAIAAGAKEIRAVQNQFYGDRSGMVSDPFGYHWNISTHVEDVPPEEMHKRAEAAMKERCKA